MANDILMSLLSKQQQEQAQENALRQGLLGLSMGLIQASQPQGNRRTSTLQALAQAAPAAVQSYQGSFDKTLRDIVLGQQMQDAQAKRKQQTAVQRALQLATPQAQIEELRRLGAWETIGGIAAAEKSLRQSGLLRQPGEASMETPFAVYAQSEVPGVAKLAKQYTKSYESGAIDDEKAAARLSELARMEAYALARTESAKEREFVRQESAEERRLVREEARLKGDKPTAEQMKAGTLAGRLNKAMKDLTKIEQEAPSALKPEVGPELLQSGLVSWIPGAEMLASKVTSEDRLRAEAAQLDALDAALTLGTGAAYTREQLRGYAKAYFPQVGDTPKVIEEKNNRFGNLVELARKQAGSAYIETSGTRPSTNATDVRSRYKLEAPR